MEEENEDHHHHIHNQPRKKLNFNAPLLSTRRPANLAAIDLSSCPSVRLRRSFPGGGGDDDGVPFSWEKAPGKPKETAAAACGGDESDDTPRPKLPPSLWRYRHVIAAAAGDPTVENEDVACDASNDVGVDEDDVFSLSEAIDIAERSEKRPGGCGGGEGLRLKIIEDRSRAEGFPDFIIQRFLPDAAALAAASLQERTSAAAAGRESPARRSAGCGIESVLFPWRSGGNNNNNNKHSRLCGVRSPDVVDHRRGDHRRHKDKRSW